MPKTIDIIKGIMLSDEPIIAIPSEYQKKKEAFYLCRCLQEVLIEGQPVASGTYLLISEDFIESLEQTIAILRLDTAPVNAFVVPYISGGAGKVTLDSSADLVVTPRLTGCTLAAEIDNPKPTLHHLNYQLSEQEARALDSSIDQNRIDDYIKRNPTTRYGAVVVRKEDYREGKKECFYSSTFMGFRQADNTWGYHSQLSEYNCSTDTYKTTPSTKLEVSEKDKADFSAMREESDSSRSCFDFFSKSRSHEKLPTQKRLAADKEPLLTNNRSGPKS